MADQYIQYPPPGTAKYSTFLAFPASSSNGDLAIALDTDVLYAFKAGTGWVIVGGPGSVLSIGSIDTVSKSSNGANISSDQLIMQTADAAQPGLVSTGTQSFAGNKTFTGTIAASNLSGTNTGDQTITLTGNVTGTGTTSFATTIAGGVIVNSMVSASAAIDGTKIVAAGVATAGAVTATTQTLDGAKTFNSAATFSAGIVGVVDGSSATAGNVGQTVSASVTSYTNVPGASAAYGDLTSISLTAGAWMLFGHASFNVGTGVNVATPMIVFISDGQASSGNSTTGLQFGLNALNPTPPASTYTSSVALCGIPINISSSKTIYFKLRINYDSGNPQYVCGLSAVRIR